MIYRITIQIPECYWCIYVGYFRGTGKKNDPPFKGEIHYLFAPILNTDFLKNDIAMRYREDAVNIDKNRLL